MKLIKTSFYTSIAQGLTLLSGLVSVKIISEKIGPSGMAWTGQFFNSTAILTLFASGAIGAGVVKYLAEYNDNKIKQFEVIRTSFWVTIICSLFIAIISLLFNKFLSYSAFKNLDYRLVFIFWGFFVVFSTLSALFNNVLNGLKLIKYLTLINICSTLIGLCITIFMAYSYGVKGVLIAPSINALFLISIHLYLISKYKWFTLKDLFTLKIDNKIFKLLGSFIFMNIISGILTPFVQLIIRNKIISKMNINDAGYWQATTKISDYYLSFVISILSVYYLPKLSELKNKQEIRQEVIYGYKLILPVVALASFVIWLLRYFIISNLMSKSFLPAANLFGIQFLGDFFKIGSWLIAYIMSAKVLKYSFIGSEILFNLSYALISVYFIELYGVKGAVIGFAISYFFYWIVIYGVVKFNKMI